MIFSDEEKAFGFEVNITKLSKRELRYFNIMRAQSGVLYIKSQPGVAKSAIIRSIASKMGMEYIDIRLSMKDETDLGLYPDKVEINGKTYLDFITPLWCLKANEKPTIIHFEELNRSTLHVRNASLQILLERAIGDEFKFNSGVFMCASGNLGHDDGTDVDEFDSALNNRLIHIKHDLTINEWIEEFAKDNVHYSINNFIISNPSLFIKQKDNDSENDAYPTPRSWTMLSDYITTIYGKDCDIPSFVDDLQEISKSYVGSSASLKYVKYLKDIMKISISDIVENYSNIQESVLKISSAHRADLVNNLQSIDIPNINKEQIDNVCMFINDLDIEHKVSYLKDFLKKDDLPDNNDNIRQLLEQSKDAIEIIKRNN